MSVGVLCVQGLHSSQPPSRASQWRVALISRLTQVGVLSSSASSSDWGGLEGLVAVMGEAAAQGRSLIDTLLVEHAVEEV